MRGWLLLLACTASAKPSSDIHPRYIHQVRAFAERCGALCVNYEYANLKMHPVSQYEMYLRTGQVGILGVAITTTLGTFVLRREVYILESLEGVQERATVIHELFHSLGGMGHTEQFDISFMAPLAVDPLVFEYYWDKMWKNDLCTLAKERGQECEDQ